MILPPRLFQQLRNTTVREIIRALERDGFTYRRTRGSGGLYRHQDGRRTVIHYHSPGDTLPLGTLRNVLSGSRWTEADLQRLELL